MGKSLTIGLTKEALLKEFTSLNDITILSLWRHVTIGCDFSLKKIIFI